jgi:hypothetical protein
VTKEKVDALVRLSQLQFDQSNDSSELQVRAAAAPPPLCALAWPVLLGRRLTCTCCAVAWPGRWAQGGQLDA